MVQKKELERLYMEMRITEMERLLLLLFIIFSFSIRLLKKDTAFDNLNS
jgi:hypothetical protein